jgi:hypothetical protein
MGWRKNEIIGEKIQILLMEKWNTGIVERRGYRGTENKRRGPYG